jgi:hypothetical protein
LNAILHSSKAQEPIAPTNGATAPPVKASQEDKKGQEGRNFCEKYLCDFVDWDIMFAGIFYKSRDDFSRA